MKVLRALGKIFFSSRFDEPDSGKLLYIQSLNQCSSDVLGDPLRFCMNFPRVYYLAILSFCVFLDLKLYKDLAGRALSALLAWKNGIFTLNVHWGFCKPRILVLLVHKEIHF